MNRKWVYGCLWSVVLAVGFFCSCRTGRGTLVDLGGGLSCVGREEPWLCPEKLPEGVKPRYGWNVDSKYDLHYRVWKKGARYLVEVPVSYLPARCSVLAHYTGRNAFNDDAVTLQGAWPNERHTTEELVAAPREYFYADLDEVRYKRLFKKRKLRNYSPFEGVRMQSSAEVDWSGAELLIDVHGRSGAEPVRIPNLRFWRPDRQVPHRCTWVYYCLSPLRWVLEVADIPLSLIATPVGWLTDAVYEPLAN